MEWTGGVDLLVSVWDIVRNKMEPDKRPSVLFDLMFAFREAYCSIGDINFDHWPEWSQAYSRLTDPDEGDWE